MLKLDPRQRSSNEGSFFVADHNACALDHGPDHVQARGPCRWVDVATLCGDDFLAVDACSKGIPYFQDTCPRLKGRPVQRIASGVGEELPIQGGGESRHRRSRRRCGRSLKGEKSPILDAQQTV